LGFGSDSADGCANAIAYKKLSGNPNKVGFFSRKELYNSPHFVKLF
jgi:hypothetical protein